MTSARQQSNFSQLKAHDEQLERLAALPISLPPAEEQAEIVRRVEGKLPLNHRS